MKLSSIFSVGLCTLLLSGCSIGQVTHEQADADFAEFCNMISAESTTWNRKEAALTYVDPEDEDFAKYYAGIVSKTTGYFLDITSGSFQDADPADPEYADFLDACKNVGVEVRPAIRFF